MSKSKVLESLTKEWELLLAISEDISDQGQLKIGSIGDWSVAQCLTHVANWDEEVMNITHSFIESGLKRSINNAPPHDFNNQHLQSKAGMDLPGTWNYFHQAHSTLMSHLESLDEEHFEPDSHNGEWLITQLLPHYIGHKQDIKGFVQSLKSRNIQGQNLG